ncbi:MAG: hypothetical protein M1490_02030 [Candidatus Bathyarchaeota archaeon]|nr:hypothetical protein [Candidatus Bathyarchaeota archaeon]
MDKLLEVCCNILKVNQGILISMSNGYGTRGGHGYGNTPRSNRSFSPRKKFVKKTIDQDKFLNLPIHEHTHVVELNNLPIEYSEQSETSLSGNVDNGMGGVGGSVTSKKSNTTIG